MLIYFYILSYFPLTMSILLYLLPYVCMLCTYKVLFMVWFNNSFCIPKWKSHISDMNREFKQSLMEIQSK